MVSFNRKDNAPIAAVTLAIAVLAVLAWYGSSQMSRERVLVENSTVTLSSEPSGLGMCANFASPFVSDQDLKNPIVDLLARQQIERKSGRRIVSIRTARGTKCPIESNHLALDGGPLQAER